MSKQYTLQKKMVKYKLISFYIDQIKNYLKKIIDI